MSEAERERLLTMTALMARRLAALEGQRDSLRTILEIVRLALANDPTRQELVQQIGHYQRRLDEVMEDMP